jgi:hypothetical protein
MVEGLTCFRVGIRQVRKLTTYRFKRPLGDKSEVEPPVPIPNTEVKHLSADDTEEVAPCGKYAIAKRLFLFSYQKLRG